jgi:hypothetical protein
VFQYIFPISPTPFINNKKVKKGGSNGTMLTTLLERFFVVKKSYITIIVKAIIRKIYDER